MTHLALAFAIADPGVTSAIIGPHTMEQLDDLLASADVTLTDDILDQIDEIVPPGTDVGTLDQAYLPPALLNSSLRRGPPVNAAATAFPRQRAWPSAQGSARQPASPGLQVEDAGSAGV